MTIGQVWLGKSLNANFEIVHDQLELEGFQLFAVEKWSVSSHHISLACSGPNMDQGHREDEAHHNFDRLYWRSASQGHSMSFVPVLPDPTLVYRLQ
jgi:hypothetical protein